MLRPLPADKRAAGLAHAAAGYVDRPAQAGQPGHEIAQLLERAGADLDEARRLAGARGGLPFQIGGR